MKKIDFEKKYKKKTCCVVAFFISLLFVIILLRLYHYAPFGNKSLAWMDGSIMYLDWFAYVKDGFSAPG